MRRLSKEQKELHGTLRPSRERERDDTLTYPLADGDDLRAPSYLGLHGKRLWRRVANLMASQQLLQVVDLSLLGQFCGAWDGYRDALDNIRKNGRILTMQSQTRTGTTSKQYRNPAVDLEQKYAASMAQFGERLGFSPAARERLTNSLSVDNAKRTKKSQFGLNKSQSLDTAELAKEFNI